MPRASGGSQGGVDAEAGEAWGRPLCYPGGDQALTFTPGTLSILKLHERKFPGSPVVRISSLLSLQGAWVRSPKINKFFLKRKEKTPMS